MTTMRAPAVLEDNGFLYMTTTVLVWIGLVAVLVWLVRLLVSRIREADEYEGAVNVFEAVWCELPEPANRLRNQMLRQRGIRPPVDTAKYDEFVRVIRVNRLKRTYRP